MISDREFTRRMIGTVLTVTATVLGVVTLYVAREALMLIYVSALIAMGFSPLVRVLAEPRSANGRRRLPRVFAILAIYVVIVGAGVLLGLLILPPLVEQASTLWAELPAHFNRFQTFLIRYKLLVHRVTLQEAVQNAPAGTGGNAVNAVVLAVWGVIGGIFGIITILILSFQLEANILVPKIMERRVGVSPVTVMVALLIGGALWGLVGAILAIPTAAILSVIVDELAAGSDASVTSAG